MCCVAPGTLFFTNYTTQKIGVFSVPFLIFYSDRIVAVLLASFFVLFRSGIPAPYAAQVLEF
jgi:hypothetical protein